MKFTFNWLKEYIDFDLSVTKLADKLTMLGLEVEAVSDLYPPLADVMVGRVAHVYPHPNADKLVLCDVMVAEQKYRIICGAPNVRAKMLTAVALPGAVLPSGFTIKSAKIRGEVSNGMLCSVKELTLSDEQTGIIELSDDLECGQSLTTALKLDDTVIEVDLTPNRPDCASVIGIAREVSGFTGGSLKIPVTSDDLPLLTDENAGFSVKIEDTAGCPRYAGRLLTKIKVAASPWWLRQRLLAVGIRPVNNVVDVTNFVMMEYGQPLHAFDFNKLAGGRIVVRKAQVDEEIVTLDGVRRVVDEETLLICDAEKPVAIAGIMGGANSEVNEQTTAILLESGYFEPVGVRRTAARLRLSSESSYRFERGVDPQAIPTALARAVQLIIKLAGGEASIGGVDCYAEVQNSAVVALRVKRANSLLGMNFTAAEISRLLTSIEIAVEHDDGQTLTVRPPSFRIDLAREIDLIEELARLVGYNEIPVTLPVTPMSFSVHEVKRTFRRQICDLMRSLGFFEAINYSFIADNHVDWLGLINDKQTIKPVTLLNPLTAEQNIMCPTLLAGLLNNVRRNLNHQNHNIRMFEVGKVFQRRDGQDLPAEHYRLTGVLCGYRHPGTPPLHDDESLVDIYDVKGVVELLCTDLRLTSQIGIEAAAGGVVYAESASVAHLKADNHTLGSFGQFTTPVLKAFGIKQDVFFLDLNLNALGRLTSPPAIFKPLPKFPSVRRDIAVLVPEAVAGGALVKVIYELDESLVEDVEIFDIYREKNITEGHKSIAISIMYRSSKQTLHDKKVDKIHQKITDLILHRFAGQLREAG